MSKNIAIECVRDGGAGRVMAVFWGAMCTGKFVNEGGKNSVCPEKDKCALHYYWAIRKERVIMGK